MTRRAFNESERQILYKAAGGRCQKCGCELHGVFHADHVKPFVLGGETDVINGQVLCEGCNLMKADNYGGLGEWSIELRDWQRHAWQAYQAAGKQDFLAVATPGSGKTIWCLRVAHFLLSHGIVDQIAIVAPSDSLRDQWAHEAANVGIHLHTVYDADVDIAADQHGIVTTYQAVAARHNTTKSYRLYTHRRRTFVVLDEVHHAGDGLTWGYSTKQAFEFAVRRLCVTGTPFRSDNCEIPFVTYEEVDGQRICRPDFVYGYGAALRDGVVRPVFFQTYDGDISWMSGGEIITASFGDALGAGRSKERLRAAISPQGNWLQQVLQDAHAKLMEIREFHGDAGGLVIAKDKYEAMQIAKLLKPISTTPVILVTSDDADAKGIIDRFRNGTNEWIVAIRIVSEGVDIKRLRVAVYATNITTELFFRQVVGRVLRIIPGLEEQDAWFYIPKDPTITAFAETLKDERNHIIDDDEDALLDEAMEQLQGDSDHDHEDPIFAVIRTLALKDDIIHDAASFSIEELKWAVGVARAIGQPNMNPVAVAMIRRHLESLGMTMPPVVSTSAPEPKRKLTLEQTKMSLRRRGGQISTSMTKVVEASNGRETYASITTALNGAQGVTAINQCSLEQLLQRVEILKAWRKAYTDGDAWREFTVKRYLREHAGASLE